MTQRMPAAQTGGECGSDRGRMRLRPGETAAQTGGECGSDRGRLRLRSGENAAMKVRERKTLGPRKKDSETRQRLVKYNWQVCVSCFHFISARVCTLIISTPVVRRLRFWSRKWGRATTKFVVTLTIFVTQIESYDGYVC